MRFPNYFAVAIIGLVCLFGTASVKAGVPQVHVSAKPTWLSKLKPDTQKPSLRHVQNGFYFELLERQINVEARADYHHIIRQIVSEAGIQNGSQLSVSFDPSYEKLDFHEITVWRDGKPQNRLNASAFKVIADEQELSKFIYQGSYSALYILSDIRKGDRIEYSYTLSGRNPIFGEKFCKDLYLQSNQWLNHEYLAVLASPDRKLNIKAFNKAPEVKVSMDGTLKKYEWESFNIPEITEHDNQPDWYNEYAHVQVSDFNSWAEVASWASSINPFAANIQGELAQQVAKLKAAAGNDQEKYFRLATETVQDEVRYMGIEIGEYSHRANNPEQVFKQRYGDCKDKSLLLVSMLRANGIEAYLVFVNTNLGAHLENWLPSAAIFDHCVVTAFVNGKQVWVDATIAYQRGTGTNIYFPNYERGLVLRPGEKALTVIPAPKTGKTACQEKYIIAKNSTKVRLDVKTVYTLNEADRMRDKLASSGMEQIEKDYLDYYLRTYSNIEARDSVRVVDDEKRNILTTYESYTVNDMLKPGDEPGRYTASFNADMVEDQLPGISNKTKTPVDVNYPTNLDYTIKVVLPGGWNVDPTDTAINRDAYRFHSSYSADGDTLSLNYRFAYLKSYVPANQIDQFKKDISDMKNGQLGYSVSFDNGGKAIAGRQTTDIWMLVYVACLIIIMARLGVWLFSRETPGIVFSYGADFMQIGGWLVLILIGLLLSPIISIGFLANNNYFALSQWNAYNGKITEGFYHLTFLLEVTGHTINAGLSAFCLVLFIKRRDILPSFIIGMFIFRIVFVITDHVMLSGLHNFANLYNVPNGIYLNAIVAAVWIAYFKRSERVQNTFIVPYPATNFSYETEEVVLN